jgi:hypothetical protein
LNALVDEPQLGLNLREELQHCGSGRRGLLALQPGLTSARLLIREPELEQTADQQRRAHE